MLAFVWQELFDVWKLLQGSMTLEQAYRAHDYAYHPLWANYLTVGKFIASYGIPLWVFLFFNTLIGIGACFLWYSILRRKVPSAALPLVAVWLFTPFGLTTYSTIRPEAVIFLITTINVVWLFSEWPQWTAYGVGLLCALGTWIYPTGLFALAPMTICAFLKNRRNAYKWMLTSYVGHALVFLTWPWPLYRKWALLYHSSSPVVLQHMFNPFLWVWRTFYLSVSVGYGVVNNPFMTVVAALLIFWFILKTKSSRMKTWAALYLISYGLLDGYLDYRHQSLIYPWILTAMAWSGVCETDKPV